MYNNIINILLPMDITQLLIIIISITITSLVVILGIQVFYILKEIRQSVVKVNKMLDDAGKVSGAVGESIVNMTGFVNGIKAGLSAISKIKRRDDE